MSPDLPKCECGHRAVLHGGDGLCMSIGCRCIRFRTPEEPPHPPLTRDNLLAEISRSLRATHPDRCDELMRALEQVTAKCDRCKASLVATFTDAGMASMVPECYATGEPHDHCRGWTFCREALVREAYRRGSRPTAHYRMMLNTMPRHLGRSHETRLAHLLSREVQVPTPPPRSAPPASEDA